MRKHLSKEDLILRFIRYGEPACMITLGLILAVPHDGYEDPRGQKMIRAIGRWLAARQDFRTVDDFYEMRTATSELRDALKLGRSLLEEHFDLSCTVRAQHLRVLRAGLTRYLNISHKAMYAPHMQYSPDHFRGHAAE